MIDSLVKRAVAFGLCALVAPALAVAGQPDTDRYIVKFSDTARGKAALKAHGGSVLLDLAPQHAAAARIPAHALENLRNNPNIEYIEQDVVRKPLSQTTPYGIPMVQADQVTDGAAANRTVCIIDSGYYRNHEDLSGNAVTGTNVSGTGNWYEDTCGHGSHVAGTVAALNNATGVVGVAGGGNLRLHIIKVFDGADCAWTYSSNLVNALNACRNAGANVVSMSLGGSFSSRTEGNAFQDAWNAGILSIAAAGNDGNTRKSYPASYDSVVSVAAIDANKVVADFSQKNDAVEVSAPGVAVLSTVPWKGASLTVGTAKYSAGGIANSQETEGKSGALVNGGRCTSAGAWAGRVVLCERGDVSFKAKLDAVAAGGGVAGAIYNNVAGGFAGTCDDGSGSTCSIPGISLSQEDGQALVAQSLGQTGTVVNSTAPGSGYEAWDGTSMATPHVAAVAAVVWSYDTAKTNAQLREALTATAEDLGAAGKDNAYGYGLVRARAALDYLGGGGGGGCTATEPFAELSCSDGADNDCDGFIDTADTDCAGGSCLPKGSSCTTADECCSLNCGGKPGRRTCK